MNPAKDIFKRAEQAARKGNSEYAVELFLQGLTLDPKAPEERRKLHHIETQVIQNAGGNASGGMKTKLSTAGNLAKVKKLKVQKKWDEAVIELERALRPQPRNTGLLFDLGGLLENLEAFDGALSTYEECIEADRGFVEAYRKLGQLYAGTDPKKAIEAWEKLRMHKPEDKEASKAIRDLSAATLVKTIDDKKAATGDDSFRAMLKSEDESADLEQKAKVIRTDEDRIEAVRFKKEELRADPTNSRLWRDLGGLYQDQHKFDHAKAAFKKALAVNPQDLFAVDKLGSLEEIVFKEQTEKTHEEYEAAVQNGADEARVRELEDAMKAADQALLQFLIEEYGRKVKAHPTDYELKIIFGEALMGGDRLDEAIEQFQKAVKDPKFKVRGQNNMGACFQKKGVHAIAIAQYTEALGGMADADSDMAKNVRYNLATAYEEKGDYTDALDQYQVIMATDIGFRDVSLRVDHLMKKM